MLSPLKWQWWAAAGLMLVVLLGALSFTAFRPGPGAGPSPALAPDRAAGAPVAQGNAFLPGGNWSAPRSFSEPTLSSAQGGGFPAPPALPAIPPPSVLGQVVSSTPVALILPSTSATLALPDVPDGEIAINPQGVSTLTDYLAYFSAHSRSIAFNGSAAASVLKDADGVALLPIELAEKVARGSLPPRLDQSLAVWRQFTDAKLAFLKTVPVYGDAVAVSKKMIGFEELTLALLDKVSAVETGNGSTSDLGDFAQKYEATAAAEHELIVSSGIIGGMPRGGVFQSLFALLGGTAHAQVASAFGGPIVWIDEEGCTCSEWGHLALIGPPAHIPPSGELYVTYAFLSSPLFFAFKQFKIGTQWLGLYGGVEVCTKYHGDECDLAGPGRVPIMVGTSM